MKQVKFICIRHGESIANIDKTIYEQIQDLKIPLSPLGLYQARQVGEELSERNNIVKIIHSPLLRTLQTAQEIQKSFKDSVLIEDPLIHEISVMHSFAEMVGKEYLPPRGKAFSEHFYKEGTAESLMDAYQRARIFAQDLILNKYKFEHYETVLIVSHGTFLVTLKAVFQNLGLAEFSHDDHMDNCEYFEHTLNVLDI